MNRRQFLLGASSAAIAVATPVLPPLSAEPSWAKRSPAEILEDFSAILRYMEMPPTHYNCRCVFIHDTLELFELPR